MNKNSRSWPQRLPWLGTIILVCLAFVGLQTADAVSDDIWTSVVRLEVNEQVVTDDFEIVDMLDYVLIPLRGLSDILDTKVSLSPAAMTATIERSWDNAVLQVNLADQTMAWGERMSEVSPSALAFEGDFFVPMEIAAVLFDAVFDWNSQTQTLSAHVERELPLFQRKDNVSGEARSPLRTESSEPKPVKVSSPVSVGSIQYVIEQGYATNSQWDSPDTAKISAYFQAADIPIDIEGRIEPFFRGERQIILDRITATYTSPSMEVVLGDSSLDLGKVLRNAEIRGLRYTAPPGWTGGRLRAFTRLEGWVEPESEVALVINDFYLGKVRTKDDGHYVFESVPLQLLKNNRIEVIVTTPSGETSVTYRTITAAPRLLPVGEKQVIAGVGQLREDGKSTFEDSILFGCAGYVGLTPTVTVGGELAWKKSLVESEAGSIASDIGVAIRVSDNLVFTLDWLMSTTGEPYAVARQGLELQATYRHARMAVQSLVFYRDPALNLFSTEVDDQKGIQVIAEYELNENLSLQADVIASTAVSKPNEPVRTTLGTAVRWRLNERSSILARLEHEFSRSDTLEVSYRFSALDMEVNVRGEGKWMGADERRELSEINSEIDLVRLLGLSAHVGLTRTDQLKNNPDGSSLHQTSSKLFAAWFPAPYRITGSVEVRDLAVWPSQFPINKEVLVDVEASRTFGRSTVGASVGIKRFYASELIDAILTTSAYANMLFLEERLLGELSIERDVPLQGDTDACYKLGTAVRYSFNNGLVASLEGEVERWDRGTMDYYVGLSLSQRIGFSNGGVRGMPVSEGRPLSYIEGVVYIDANGNGKRDMDEKGVPDIPVRLDGRRDDTDSNGYYCFEF